MLAEAKAALPSLYVAATAPADEAGVKTVIGRRFALFPQPVRSDGEWAEWWADYIDVIGHLPEGAIEAAVAAWVRDPSAEFMPKPGKLLELAKMTPNRDVRSYERARGAIDYRPASAEADPNYIDPKVRGILAPILSRGRPEPSQADKDQVRQQMREFIAQDDERKAALKARAVDLPPAHGATDDGGVTLEMRALQQRQAGGG